MHVGPVDIIEIGFPGNQFNGAILPALQRLMEAGTVRVLDLLLAFKTADGEIGSLELSEFVDKYGPLFVSIDSDVPGGLLDADDVEELGDALEPDSSIAVIAIEHTWAIPLVEALEGSGAVIVDQARVPREAVLAALAGAEG